MIKFVMNRAAESLPLELHENFHEVAEENGFQASFGGKVPPQTLQARAADCAAQQGVSLGTPWCLSKSS